MQPLGREREHTADVITSTTCDAAAKVASRDPRSAIGVDAYVAHRGRMGYDVHPAERGVGGVVGGRGSEEEESPWMMPSSAGRG